VRDVHQRPALTFLDRLASPEQRPGVLVSTGSVPNREYNDGRHLGLTQRQRSVLRLMLLGLPNKGICRELSLAEGTVKVHVSAILRALGVATRAQVVIAANRSGIKAEEIH
jgi:DNA-binding NarL/FixJ family response regulator